MSKLTWKRLDNGDLLCREHPIKLIKPMSRRADDAGWMVRVPYERDSNFDDGWQWRYLESPATTLPVEMGGGLKGDNSEDAKALVAEHLDYALAAIPAEYGQPEPEPGPITAPPAADRPPAITMMYRPTQMAVELREVIDGLTRSIDEFRESVPRSFDTFIRTQRPEEVRDVNGRPILGDMLAGKANALAALANLERSAT